jgi:hypothetical protein
MPENQGDDANNTDELNVTVTDCNVYENIQGTGWGANAAQASANATAECNKVFAALRITCPDECPVARTGKSVGKPRPNKITIALPWFSPITIQIGWVCDYEIIYGCFARASGEPA